MCPGAEPRWCWIKTEREAGAGPQASWFGFGLGLGMAFCRSLLGSRRGGRDAVLIPLCVNVSEQHRRRVWEAWESIATKWQ